MEMPRKNFDASISFSFDKGGEQWWTTKADAQSVQRIEDSSIHGEYPNCDDDDESEPESKRFRSILTSFQQNPISSRVASASLLPTSALSLSDTVDVPRPLGLNLRKSQSLVDLIQQNLSQNDHSSPLDQDFEENIKAKGIAASESQQDKLKASNFPACYLKIGKWECSSVYEGDLVAKCYYAKRKLVWEVLDNGLKSKIEIQWSDITGLKADIPEKGLAYLHVEISRTPLFFRETNPQPRKHTLWQSTPDFTAGQASICRRHQLQFSEGILNRHYEKLIQCDPRLKHLSEQSMPFSGSPFFEGRMLMLDMHRHHQYLYPGNNSSSLTLGSLQNELLMNFSHSPDPIVKQSNLHQIERSDERTSVELQPFSPSSVMDSRANDESSNSDTEELYAEQFRRDADYKKTGISMLFDEGNLYGDGSFSSTRPHTGTNVVSTSMVSGSNLPQCRVHGDQVPFSNNNAALSEKDFLQRLSNHLFEETAAEKFVASVQSKDFPGKFIQDTEEQAQQKKLSSGSLFEHIRMTNSSIHGHSGPSYTLGLGENIGLSYTIKEKNKSTESPLRAVKMENTVSSELNGTVFYPSRNSFLHGGQSGKSAHSSFCDPLDSLQVPHLF